MEQRLIDANAYATEMKSRQDALKELIDDAVAMDNWEMYDGLSRAFSVFVEAKLTLDAMPTVDAVPVVRCMECKRWTNPIPIEMKKDGYGYCGGLWTNTHKDDFCAWGERRTE